MWNKVQSSLFYVKIALCAIVVYLLILSVFARVFQTNKSNLYPKKIITKTSTNTDSIRALITDKKINSTKGGKVVVYFYKGMVCSLIGEACYDDLDKKNPSNASAVIASLFAYPFLNPPASGVGATIQTLAQAGFIPKSYAAEGVGFASIRPLMNVWKAMRDVAYLLLVLVIVTIGFMIMLRTKINPQTVINVENALPKIVIALIYITFSFAIAGFLIDLMYVVMILIIAILGPEYSSAAAQATTFGKHYTWNATFVPQTTPALIQKFLLAGPWSILQLLFNFDIKSIFWTLPQALLNILGGFVQVILRTIIMVVSAFLLTPWLGKVLIEPFNKVDAEFGVGIVVADLKLTGIIKYLIDRGMWWIVLIIAVVGGLILVPLILGIIIFLTVLMLFFRILGLIFSGYIKLFVLIITAPLFLIIEAIPGQSTFGIWFKNILETLVPYPVIIATFLIGSIIMGASSSGVLFTPPFLVGLNAEYLTAIVGVWILFMIPDFIMLVQKAVNPKPLPLDSGIGAFFGGAKTGVETGLGEMSKYALLAGQFKPLGAIFNMIPGFEKKK